MATETKKAYRWNPFQDPPCTEQEWRDRILYETCYRASRTALASVPAALDPLGPKAASDVWEAISEAVYRTTRAAINVSEAMRGRHLCPETEEEAEPRLVALLREALAGHMPEDELTLRQMTDPALLAELNEAWYEPMNRWFDTVDRRGRLSDTSGVKP